MKPSRIFEYHLSAMLALLAGAGMFPLVYHLVFHSEKLSYHNLADCTILCYFIVLSKQSSLKNEAVTPLRG